MTPNLTKIAILRDVLAVQHPKLELPNIALRYELTLRDLQAFLRVAGYPDRERMRAAVAHLEVERVRDELLGDLPTPEMKTCSRCMETKPLSEFYSATDTKDGRGAHCRDCNNDRPITESRMLRNRARNRAYALLVERHRAEYDELLATEYIKVREEHERVVAEAAARGQHDAATARLKPGPKRKEQTDVTERLDVARCPNCRTHHDASHVCPECGEVTPAQPASAPAYAIREWATAQGLVVHPRGPIPQHLIRAYLEAHTQEASA